MGNSWVDTAANTFSAVGTAGALVLGLFLPQREHRREASRTEDERRRQAARISTWIEAYRMPNGTSEIAFHIHNASDMPIYEVELPQPVPTEGHARTDFVGPTRRRP